VTRRPDSRRPAKRRMKLTEDWRDRFVHSVAPADGSEKGPWSSRKVDAWMVQQSYGMRVIIQGQKESNAFLKQIVELLCPAQENRRRRPKVQTSALRKRSNRSRNLD
jgi:hypothetical protein